MGWFSKKKERPDVEDVVVRTVVLRHVFQYSLMLPTPDNVEQASLWWTDSEKREFSRDSKRTRDDHWAKFGSYSKHLSPSEKVFSRTTIDSVSAQQMINASWRVESLTALLWSLGFIDAIPPYDTQSGPEHIGDLMLVDAAELVANAKLRQTEEIDNARHCRSMALAKPNTWSRRGGHAISGRAVDA